MAVKTKKSSVMVPTPVSAIDEAAVQEVREGFQSLLQDGNAAIAEVRVGKGECPNTVLLAVEVIKRIKGAAEKNYKAWKEFLVQHKKKGGTFESGRAVVEFIPIDPRQSVAWKQVALELAAENAKLRGKQFDPAKWEKRVLDALPTGEKSLSVKIAIVDEADEDEE